MKIKKIIIAILAALGLSGGGYAGYQTLGGFYLQPCTGGLTATSTLRTTATGDHYYIEEDNAFFLGKTDEVQTGTSTMECSIGNADLVDLNLFFVGSSTAAYPTWDYEFSHDGKNWFVPTVKTVKSDNTITYGTSTYSFPRGLDGDGEGNGTTTINLKIDPLAAQYIRINFGSTGSNGTATGTLYAEIIKRNQN